MPAKAFVIGHPIQHSRSPLIHGHWLREHGLEGSYTRIDVPPAELAGFLAGMEAEGFVGGNVTIPHKEAAFALCDVVSESARHLGAVNTLWRQDGRLHGDNTDGIGFLANLDEQAPDWQKNTQKALVIGAGGAARSIAHGLLERGLQVMIANRTPARAEALAAELAANAPAGAGAGAVPWEALSGALDGVGLIVNTTSLGMKGQPPLELDLAAAPADAVVADIVYVPLETALLAAARTRGLACVDGLGMLLHQAVPGFARWFGVRPKVTPELRAIIVADLEAAR